MRLCSGAAVTSFLWVHPHYTRYSTHIEITPEWFYVALSAEGTTLVKVCKLDDAEVLGRRRAAHAYASQSADIANALLKFSAHHARLARQDCLDALIARFQLPQEVAEEVLDKCRQAGLESDTDLLGQAIRMARAAIQS